MINLKQKLLVILSIILFVYAQPVNAKENWPRKISIDNGIKVTMYQPQHESLQGNKLFSRAVVSLQRSNKAEPVFGVVWTEATLITDKDTRMAKLAGIIVTDVKLPDVTDQSEMDELRSLLETEIPTWNLILAIDEIVATIEREQGGSADDFNTDAPKIIYRDEPSVLVNIDGDPIVKYDDQIKMDRLMNTPYLIVKNPADNQFYLYAGSLWYRSSSVESNWSAVSVLPSSITNLDKEVRQQEKEAQAESGSTSAGSGVPATIIVSKVPAELLQTDGAAEFSSVEGTGLMYVSNTSDYIFKNIDDQKYYVLLAGRWYKASSLKGPWNYIASDKLPADFSKIPEGTDQDEVLANVAGTYAAREAVMDAQIPQTARVDRYSATSTVTYDGDPKFELIEGTDIYTAINSSVTVMFANNLYYALENGVWFVSEYADGPWSVSTDRPSQIEKIPPTSIVYNTKYVYIYDVTPDYVYMGYTPGYLNSFVYGPTVIYGTGYHYHPWHGIVYYPRPITWGYGMHYNPWYGWGMSYQYRYCCNHYYYDDWYYGGWWGPPAYRPPYYPPYEPGYGHYYGPRPGYNQNVNVNHSNNIYTNRKDVVTNDVNQSQRTRSSRDARPAVTKPSTGTAEKTRSTGTTNPTGRTVETRSTRTTNPTGTTEKPRSTGTTNPTGTTEKPRSTGTTNPTGTSRSSGATRVITPKQSTSKTKNNVYSDKTGNVYRKEAPDNWQQRDEGSWKPAVRDNKPAAQQMDRSANMRDRSDMRVKQGTPTKSEPSKSSSSGKARSTSVGKTREK